MTSRWQMTSTFQQNIRFNDPPIKQKALRMTSTSRWEDTSRSISPNYGHSRITSNFTPPKVSTTLMRLRPRFLPFSKVYLGKRDKMSKTSDAITVSETGKGNIEFQVFVPKQTSTRTSSTPARSPHAPLHSFGRSTSVLNCQFKRAFVEAYRFRKTCTKATKICRPYVHSVINRLESQKVHELPIFLDILSDLATPPAKFASQITIGKLKNCVAFIVAAECSRCMVISGLNARRRRNENNNKSSLENFFGIFNLSRRNFTGLSL